jgi:hypothetical protein
MSPTNEDLDAAEAATASTIADYREAVAKNDGARVSLLVVEIGRAYARESALRRAWAEPEPTAEQDEQIARLGAARPPSKYSPSVLKALAAFDEAFADANTVAVTAARWAAEYAVKQVFGEAGEAQGVGDDMQDAIGRAFSELQENFADIVARAFDRSNKHKV